MTCNFCGAQSAGDTPPLTWATSVEQGQTRVFCDRCARDNLRSIEGKLDSDWW